MRKSKGNKPFYLSKTKWGALLGGTGVILTTVGALVKGNISLANAIPTLLTEVGIILGIFGIRDLPFINK